MELRGYKSSEKGEKNIMSPRTHTQKASWTTQACKLRKGREGMMCCGNGAKPVKLVTGVGAAEVEEDGHEQSLEV